jgi:hypothetical protein
VPFTPIIPPATLPLVRNKYEAMGALIGYAIGVVLVAGFTLYRRARYGKWWWKDSEWP